MKGINKKTFLFLLGLSTFLLAHPAEDDTVSLLKNAIPRELLPANYRNEQKPTILIQGESVIIFVNGPSIGHIEFGLRHYPNYPKPISSLYESFVGILQGQKDTEILATGLGFGESSVLYRRKWLVDARRNIVLITGQIIDVYWEKFRLEVGIHGYQRLNGQQDFSHDQANQLVRQLAQATFEGILGKKETGSDCGKSGLLTRYLEALRQHRQKLSNLNVELERKINGPKPDRQTVMDLGGNAQSIAADFQKTLKAFSGAETRRGLQEEVDLFIDSAQVLNQVVGRYQQLAGVPVIPLQKSSLVNIKSNMVRTIFKLAREKYASRLESEGLRDILTSESWNEVLDKAAYHSQRKLDEFLERETEKIFGFGFHDGESARRALRLQMRREICRQVAKLLVKITSNAIVIEIVAGPIIRWIESELLPKLREALRQKGNLPERLERSIETMKNASLDLNKLPCDAKLRVVAMRLNAAAGVLHATRYLERDLGNQWGDDLFKLAAEKENLARTMKMTRVRFLLVRDDYEDELEFADSEVGQLLKNLQAAVFTVQGSALR